MQYRISYVVLLASFINTLLVGYLCAQKQFIISGYVYDRETNEGLSYVNVFIKDSYRGTVSDQHGDFSFAVQRAGSFTIVFSMMGYKTETRKIFFDTNDSLYLKTALIPTQLYLPGITIYAARTIKQKQSKATSSTSFRTQRIADMPFLINDVNRAIKTLPGITSNNEKSSEFNVRGGTFDENLVCVDGIPINRPFHLKSLPNASISILNLNLMESVNLISGGFPAEYGDKMSSVMDITYRSDSFDSLSGIVEFGVINSNLFSAIPVSKQNTCFIAANISYFEPAIRMMNRYRPELLKEVGGIPQFYDAHMKWDYHVNNNHAVSLIMMNASDTYTDLPEQWSNAYTRNYASVKIHLLTQSVNSFKGNSFNRLLALRSVNHFTNRFSAITSVAYYREHENFVMTSSYGINNKYYSADGNVYRGFSNYSSFDRQDESFSTTTLTAKSDMTVKLSPMHELKGGVHYDKIYYRYDLNELSERVTIYNYSNGQGSSDIDTLDYDDNYVRFRHYRVPNYKIAMYVQDSWQFNDHIFTNIGLRYDFYFLNQSHSISPRFSASYTFDNGMIIKWAWGKFFQSPMFHELKYKSARTDNTKNQQSTHFIAGINTHIGSRLKMQLDAYYKKYADLIPYYLRAGYQLSTKENRADGFATGLDFQINYSIGTLSGWLSYGYLIARENDRTDDRGYYPRSRDQRHTVSMIMDWRLTPNWQLFSSISYGSGFPYTPFQLDTDELRFRPGPRNADYLPSYSRVDIRISRDWELSRIHVKAFFEIINLLNHDNVFTYDHYSINELGILDKQPKRLLPTVPNIGLKILF